MRKFIWIILCLMSTTLYSQEVARYESQKDDSYIYYTLVDTTTNIVLEQGQYLNNERHGTWVRRWPDGDIQAIIKFTEGRRRGTWKFWNENGDLVYQKRFNRSGDLIFASQYRYY